MSEAKGANRRVLAALAFDALRYRYLRMHYKAMRRRPDRRVRRIVRQDGLLMDVDGADVIDFALDWFGVWEPQLTRLIEALLEPGDLALDVGANVGAHTLTMARLVGGSGRVIAFEPGTDTFARLAGNAALNGLTQIEARQAAAGAAYGRLPLHRAADGTRGRASLDAAAACGPAMAEVEVAPLAQALSDADWPRVRLIKIDVERYERPVLVGLAPAFDRLDEACALVVEFPPPFADPGGPPLAALVEPLLRRGFALYVLENRSDLKALMRPGPLRLVPAAAAEGEAARARAEGALDYVVIRPERARLVG